MGIRRGQKIKISKRVEYETRDPGPRDILEKALTFISSSITT